MGNTSPKGLEQALKALSAEEIFVVGGAVRDLLLGRPFLDIDLVVSRGAKTTAQGFAMAHGGTLVPLDQDRGVFRVALGSKGPFVDFSALREGAQSLEEDLFLRDFTINAIAMDLSAFLAKDTKRLIDPTGGKRDLEKGILRVCHPLAFKRDPLRMLRGFRFFAEFGFTFHEDTWRFLLECEKEGGLGRISPERINYELTKIIESDRSGPTFSKMADSSTLFSILPEFKAAIGVEQPGFHHLDVFWHCLETLVKVEEVIMRPGDFFHPYQPMTEWLAKAPLNKVALKWAALLHDIGKAECRGQKGERVTFYNHDSHGAALVRSIAKRLKWSGALQEKVERMVRLHMHPFHLLNNSRTGGPSARSLRRFLMRAGDDYKGVFLLAMADTLAGCGPLRPKDLERQLAELFYKVHSFWQDTLRPIKTKKRILTGKDIMEHLHLPQGPVIGQILDALEEAQCEGRVKDRASALKFLSTWRDSGDESH